MGTKHLPGILVAGGGSDDAQGTVGSQLLPVQVCGLRVSGQPLGPLLHNGMPGTGVARDHHVLGNVLLIGFCRDFFPLSQFHNALGMGDAGTQFEKHRGVIFLGKLEGPFGKCPRLL